jgi:hypothetical protein
MPGSADAATFFRAPVVMRCAFVKDDGVLSGPEEGWSCNEKVDTLLHAAMAASPCSCLLSNAAGLR